MNFRYDIYLQQQLEIIARDVGLGDYIFDVAEEREFAKKQIEPNKIYVIVKYLSADKIIGAETQPIQLLILTEQNDIQNTMIIFNQLANKLNFNAFNYTYYDGNESKSEYVKEQYSTPVVLSNFNQVAYGYRSVLYVSVTLYVLSEVADVESFQVDGDDIDLLSFNFSYNMTGDTQQRPSQYLSTTVRSVSSVVLSITMSSQQSDLLTKALNIVKGQTSGNQEFAITFIINSILFSYNMKLSSFGFVTSPLQVPSVSIGWVL